MLSKEEVKFLEEEIKCERAIFSSESGIISVPEYLTALEEDIKKNRICSFSFRVKTC